MKRLFREEGLIADRRYFMGSLAFVLVFVVLLFRLWYLQIFRGDYYQALAEKNRIRKIEIPAPRGIIYDRYGQVVLGNKPSYDLVLIRQYANDIDETFRILSRLLHVPVTNFTTRLRNSKGHPRYAPIVLKRNLSLQEVSQVETNRIFLPGIEVGVAPRRDYLSDDTTHLVGYLGEIDPEALKKLNATHLDDPYMPGDLIGKQGIEARWENELRGKNGHRLIQVDALGQQTSHADLPQWLLPMQPAKKGLDIELSLDLELHKIARDAFKGKSGALIALDPRSGEILVMLSEPSYDPTIYQSALSRDEWLSLTNNPFKPLFDKTTGGEYIPGSIYKALIAMAALEEKIVTPQTTFHCPGHYSLGDQVFQCHQRQGHGIVDLRKALVKSCDVYFYHVGVELGVDRIAQYAEEFGLGKRLNVEINMESEGLVPTSAWKKTFTGKPWMGGDTPNIAIGQGYNLMTPIQMVSMYAAIANGGKVWRPFIVNAIVNEFGQKRKAFTPQVVRTVEKIKPETMALIRKYLEAVVSDEEGTGRNARVENVTVAGKTGSAQVVSLKKNNRSEDVSLKWKEHAIFAAFSPAENAEIAVIIVSENDSIGGGGAQAAPVAGKVLQAYWNLKKSRQERASLSAKDPKTKMDDERNRNEKHDPPVEALH